MPAKLRKAGPRWRLRLQRRGELGAPYSHVAGRYLALCRLALPTLLPNLAARHPCTLVITRFDTGRERLGEIVLIYGVLIYGGMTEQARASGLLGSRRRQAASERERAAEHIAQSERAHTLATEELDGAQKGEEWAIYDPKRAGGER